MDLHQYVNSVFQTGDQLALSKIFDIGDRAVLHHVQTIDLSLIAPPFDTLLGAYKNFVRLPTFENSLFVLRNSGVVLSHTRVVKQIVKNSMWGMAFNTRCNVDLFVDGMVLSSNNGGAAPDELNTEFKNMLLNLFNATVDRNTSLSIYISNILCMMYLEEDDYRRVTDLVALSTPVCKNSDYYVFMFYKGLIDLYNERFREGYDCILTAFRFKKLRKRIFPMVFSVSLLALGTGRADRRDAKSENRPGETFVRYSPSFFDLDVFSECLDRTLDDSSPYFTSDDLRLLLKSREIISNGFIDILENSMPVEFYCRTHLIRLMKIFQPLVCFRNLIYRFYVASNYPSKLSILDVLRFTNKERAEVYCAIISCIHRGLIRGYLSVDKETIVLSKVAPFPDILKVA